MREDMTKSMTSGNPMKLIFSFFVSLLLGMLFQQFYNLIDSAIVGRILGAKALAAVGGTGAINFMIIGFCMGVCNGFAIPVAQAFGAEDPHALRKYVANSVWLGIGFAAVMTVGVCIYCYDILCLMKTPKETLAGSYEYIFVIFMGIPVIYLYNLLAGILRSLGDSKTPLYFLGLSSGLNILFDIFAIVVLKMGVSGAAWATVVAQGISGILCLVYMAKKFPILRISKEEWKPDLKNMGELCMMGIPMGLQYSITAIGSVILQTAVNSLGYVSVAGMTAGLKIGMFFCCPFDALGSTMATYSGQNIGAGKYKRVTQGMLSCCLIAVIYSAVSCLILSLFGKYFALLFVKKEETEVIKNAALFLRYNSMFYIPLALVNIVRFSIQGMGYSVIAILAGVCEMVARALVGFEFVPRYGYIAACFASPVAWIMADIFLVPAYFYVLNKAKKRIYKMELDGIMSASLGK